MRHRKIAQRLSEDSTEIENQKEQKRRMQEAKTVHGRPPGRPVCTRCTDTERSTLGQLLQGSGRPTERSQVSVGDGRLARSTVAWVGRPAGQPTDAFFAVLYRFGFHFWLGSNPAGVS